jgi:hypothetical protein
MVKEEPQRHSHSRPHVSVYMARLAKGPQHSP